MDKTAILCVDDEAIILMSLKEELRMNLGDKYYYETALNASEAFRAIDELTTEGIRVILIISDWLMPGMKGDEFLITIRAKYPAIKSILITGQADDAAVERVKIHAGTSAVLRKPWSTEELIQAVETCCQSESNT